MAVVAALVAVLAAAPDGGVLLPLFMADDGGVLLDGGQAVPLSIRGNLVMPEEVYRVVLSRPQAATDEEAARLAAEATRFLESSGYELATVRGAVQDGGIALVVSEGLLEKVVFRGRLTFSMIQLKLGLDLPKDVFNRPQIAAQLEELSARLRIERPSWRLVPTAQVEHVGPQMESLGPLDPSKGSAGLTLGLVRPAQKYELHIRFVDPEWGTGPGVDVRVSYFDGLEAGLNSQGKNLVFPDDRWRVALMGGAGVRREVSTGALYVFPSRLYTEGLWYTPAVARVVRAFVWLRGEGLARQRGDLGLENYFNTSAELSLNVQLAPTPQLTLAVGAGIQHFFLFGERAAQGRTPMLGPEQQRWWALMRARAELELEPVLDGRWDRRHGLDAEGLVWTNLSGPQPPFAAVRARWQKVVPLGWHDIWLKAKLTVLAGDVLYPFEEPLGEYARGVFDIFVRSAAGGSAEFRFSLTRDVYKLGVFVDVVGWGRLDRASRLETPYFAVAAGPTFHALVVGMFQMDLGVSFGWIPGLGRLDTGLWAQVAKVF